MWVTTPKCCAANTTDLRAIDLQGLEPIIASRKELWSGHLLQRILSSQGASIGSRHLFGESTIKDSLVQLVTG